jgi:hypothetical protein
MILLYSDFRLIACLLFGVVIPIFAFADALLCTIVWVCHLLSSLLSSLATSLLIYIVHFPFTFSSFSHSLLSLPFSCSHRSSPIIRPLPLANFSWSNLSPVLWSYLTYYLSGMSLRPIVFYALFYTLFYVFRESVIRASILPPPYNCTCMFC